MATTTETGNAFRDAVCELLRTKYPNAKVEQRINGTKVDILFSRDDGLGSKELVAVECKDYATPLTKSQITREIYPQYNVMLDARSIQRAVIVSRKPLGADASEIIKGWNHASHLTYDELAESLLGLRDYLQCLAALKPTDDAEYVETRLEGDTAPALGQVESWVESAGAPGLALLGGYGQGKTSFAKRVAAHYANAHLANPAARMPILVHLGEVVHETQLEGLFGKEFTSRHHVPGYQFRTLEHLNQAGRLLVILDGFDEMKHAMTAAEFQANFREFNRFLVGRAKVLLLGRPNALPSDERDLVFRGTFKVGSQVVPSSDFAPWSERKLAFFAPDESRHLLSSTLERLMLRNAATGSSIYPPNFLNLRIGEVFEKVPGDLLQRPVHILIIAELASSPDFDLVGFNEYSLYDHFIRKLVERDTREKRARRAIALDARLRFQRELAWWAWRRVGSTQGNFYRHEVPATLLNDLPDGNASDEEGKRNEYIVSTLTEEKESGVLFFAHRSFQEFLVAERVRATPTTPATHFEYSNYLTPDVMDFLRQAPSLDFVCDWYDTLRASHGPLQASYLDFYAGFPEVLVRISETLQSAPASQIDAWTVCILLCAYRQGTEGALESDRLVEVLCEVVRAAEPAPAATAALALLTLFGRTRELPLIDTLVASMLERCLSRASLHNDRNTLLVPKAAADFAFTWLKGVSKVFPSPGQVKDFTLELRLRDLEITCIKGLQPKGATELLGNPFGDLPEDTTSGTTSLPAARVYRLLPKGVAEAFASMLHGRKPKFGVIEVDRQQQPDRQHGSFRSAQPRTRT